MEGKTLGPAANIGTTKDLERYLNKIETSGQIPSEFDPNDFKEIMRDEQIQKIVNEILEKIPINQLINDNIDNNKNNISILIFIITILVAFAMMYFDTIETGSFINELLLMASNEGNSNELFNNMFDKIEAFHYSQVKKLFLEFIIIGVGVGAGSKIFQPNVNKNEKKLFALFNQLTEKLATVKNQDLAKKMAQKIGEQILATTK